MCETRIRHSLSYSVILHAIFFGLLAWWAQNLPSPRDFRWVEIDLVPLADQFKNRIVESEKGALSKTPAPNAFLGKQTRTVEEQTVAKGGEMLFDSVPEVPKELQAPSNLNEVRPLSRFGVALVPAQNKRSAEQPHFVQMGEKMNLQSQEYIKGLKESETTALNTKEYIFYTYFERIRQRLNQAWKPILREKIAKIYRRGRFLATGSDYLTRTVVTLNEQGEVVRVRVVEESGTHDLDEAAVRAFNEAGPFPNPPRNLMDANGLVEIRWDFVLKT